LISGSEVKGKQVEAYELELGVSTTLSVNPATSAVGNLLYIIIDSPSHGIVWG